MAHIQYNGKRISGQRRSVAVGQSMQLELWGPKHASGEYMLISSDSGAAEVKRGAYAPAKNAQLYTVTGTGLSSNVKLEIVAGALVDAGKKLDRANTKKPYISCDHVFLDVLPAGGKVVWADYFDEVIPAIAEGIKEYNASGETPAVDKAGFLLVQTYNEQSPGVTGKPSKHGNRMFNVQALVTRDANNKITGVVPGQEEAGVSIKSLSQGEGATNESRKMLSSPTFNYDTPKRAVTHYFKVLKNRYGKAYAVITDKSGSFGNFVGALKAAGYATHEAYAEDLKSSAKRIIREGRAWLDYELKALDHDISEAGTTAEADALKKKRELLGDFDGQLSRYKP